MGRNFLVLGGTVVGAVLSLRKKDDEARDEPVEKSLAGIDNIMVLLAVVVYFVAILA